MARSSPARIAVLASDDWIGTLLGDFLRSCDWQPVSIPAAELGDRLERVEGCALMLCDLDLKPMHLALIRRVERPIIYFSSSAALRDVTIPRDAAGAFDLPPDWPELRRMIESLL